jgi:hypothetical protein
MNKIKELLAKLKQKVLDLVKHVKELIFSMSDAPAVTYPGLLYQPKPIVAIAKSTVDAPSIEAPIYHWHFKNFEIVEEKPKKNKKSKKKSVKKTIKKAPKKSKKRK